MAAPVRASEQPTFTTASMPQLPESAPTANPVFYRTYSRRTEAGREPLDDVIDRNVQGLVELGKLTPEEQLLIASEQEKLTALPSGRWLWVGGTPWLERPENFSGGYNCSSTSVTDWESFGLMMALAMMGSGTGAVLEPHCIGKLPIIDTKLNVRIISPIGESYGQTLASLSDHTLAIDGSSADGQYLSIQVGDSRDGWCKAYQALLEASSSGHRELNVYVDLSLVRPAGTRLKGFGGTANPSKLTDLFGKVAHILNKAHGRQLTSTECCLLIDEAALVVVAGNIRRCLPGDALVHTAEGLLPIRDIKIGQSVLTPAGMRAVAGFFEQGEQEVVHMRTNAGVVRATANHRVAVLSSVDGSYEWKEFSQLQPGDRLLSTQAVTPGAPTSLPPDNTATRPPGSRTAKPFTVPDLDEEIAWFIGFLHGNGHIGLGRNKHGKPYGQITFVTCSDREYGSRVFDKLLSALKRWGVEAKQQRSPSISSEQSLRVQLFRIRFAEYLHDNFKSSNHPLQIPDCVLRATPEVRSAYLAGLMDSDGAHQNRPPHALTTIWPDFARQVQVLYASLGIPARMVESRERQEGWRKLYSVTIPAFKERYNWLVAPHSAKGEIKETLETHGFTVPMEMARQDWSYSDLRQRGFNSTAATLNVKRIAHELDYIPVTVIGISHTTVEDTYDIEVADQHCFYADGILTHNSAGMRQFAYDDQEAAASKDNLWSQGENGAWRIDPEKDALRMANHTRVAHTKPPYEDILEAVTKQFYSGEGAIQYAPEAIYRGNVDLIDRDQRTEFLNLYCTQGAEAAKRYLRRLDPSMPEQELEHRLQRYGLNPCGEINGKDFHCNLAEVHLNRLDPDDFTGIERAFKAAAISVASLLHHEFEVPRYRYSREIDPIVGVSFTGLFDFFVKAFGLPWLVWWQQGRPRTDEGLRFLQAEAGFLQDWRAIVEWTIDDYCDLHGLRTPNRCTTVQPAGTKSLLTNASPGWHPPKAQRFIRRITFGKGDPVALACMDYGYTVVPSQSDTDSDGNLLDDPFDPRCTEWLVELPVEAPWANLPGADAIDISQFSALAQFDFYMQVQTYYTTHNTSATIEFREDEIEPLAQAIHQAIQSDRGYISAALLARFDSKETFPRLPFEPISKEAYDRLHAGVLSRRKSDNFLELLRRHDSGEAAAASEAGPAGCDSDKCMLPEARPKDL